MDFVKGGKGHEQRSEEILKQWEEEKQREIDNRRDRQSRKDDDLCGDNEKKS